MFFNDESQLKNQNNEQSKLISLSHLQSQQPISILTTTASSANSALIQPIHLDTEINSVQSNNLLNTSTSHAVDWSCSLFKPASRFSMSSRRECKSTSDETYTHELNANDQHVTTLISPIRNSSHSQFNFNQIINTTSSNNHLTKTSANSVGKVLNQEWLLSTVNTKLAKGKFGFNPTSSNNFLSLRSKVMQIADSKHLAHKLNVTSSNHHNHSKEKKCVKRLNCNSKFFLDNVNKKNAEFNHNKKLFHAVLNNDFNLVSTLLDTNMYDVNCGDDKQRTCLHIAASRGYLEITKLLLDYGANPNLRDCVTNLPIHLAIIASHVPVVTLLLEAGTDIHTLDLNGKTVLHLAGTRLRWLLNDENDKASAKLKFEAIMIMNMIKEYLRRKKTSSCDLDMLANRLENVFNFDDINSLTKELLNKFEMLDLTKLGNTVTDIQNENK